MRDLVPDIEHQMAGVRILPHLPIDQAPQVQGVRIGDLVGGGDPGAEGRMGVEGLAQRPLRRPVLPHALGDVVADAPAEDGGAGVGAGDVPAAGADHRDHLDLVVAEGCGDLDRVEGSRNGRSGLREPDLAGRGLDAALGDMVGIVQANGPDLPGTRDGSEQADAVQRQGPGAGAGEAANLRLDRRPAADQSDHVGGQARRGAGQGYDAAAVDDARFRCAAGGEGGEFHGAGS